MKIVKNVLQCVLCNSSRCHYLEPLKKGVIEKLAYLVKFWLILESVPHTKYLMNWYETIKKHTIDYTLTNTFGFNEFGSIMKKLWRFYPKHLVLTSFRTGHKPFFPHSVTPKIQRPQDEFLTTDTWICFLTCIAISESESL